MPKSFTAFIYQVYWYIEIRCYICIYFCIIPTVVRHYLAMMWDSPLKMCFDVINNTDVTMLFHCSDDLFSDVTMVTKIKFQIYYK